MAEEFRDDKKLMIAADVPGLRPDRDISVSINSDILHIRAGQGDVWVPETTCGRVSSPAAFGFHPVRMRTTSGRPTSMGSSS